MKVCVWNVRGASRDGFIPTAWNIIESQHPSIFILLETKSDDYRAKEVMMQLHFTQFKVISPTDKRGGIWLFWKNSIDLVLFSEDVNQFHVLFHFENVRPEVLITGLHAPSVPGPRHALWRNMADNLPPPDTPWLMVGDMNEVTSQSEKMGGRPFRSGKCKDLRNFMDAAGLVDLGYHGNPYTWTNARDGAGLIRERLDRALANSPWLDIFPHTQVHHLPRTHSDHCPIIVSLHHDVVEGPFPFRCKEVWMEHPQFKDFFLHNWSACEFDFIKGRDSFLKNIVGWNSNVFGNLRLQKKTVIGAYQRYSIGFI
nr:uncharacterized protein LOC110782531 [Spinacia oleracea]